MFCGELRRVNRMTVEEMTQITLNHWKMNYPEKIKKIKQVMGVFCKPQILKIAKKNPHPHLGKFSLWRLSFSPCCLNHRRAGCNYGAQVCLS